MKPRFVIKDQVRSASLCPAPATLGVDCDGRITAWSSAAGDLFGLTASLALEHDFADLLVHRDDCDRVKEALGEVGAGRRWAGVLSARCAGADARDVDFRWDAAQSADARTVAMVSADVAVSVDGLGACAGQERLALLNEASSRIGSTLDIGQTAAELIDVAVPRLADTAGVLVLERLLEDEVSDRETDGAAVVRRLAAGVAGPQSDAWRTAFPIDEVSVYPAWTPYAQAMATRRSVLFGRLDSELAKEIAQQVCGREMVSELLHQTSFLVVPLKARGEVLGFVVLARRPDREEFGDQDVALAEELAARAAICIDNARLYNQERRTALTLQSSLLPTNLGTPLGLEIAHRYLPASDLTGVGGDWFDVIPLPGSRVALVVGDVMGHGTRAAATMGQLRTAVRTLAALDLPPAEVLHRLDQMTQDLDATQIATCMYATYDPVGRGWAFARAGHVPPIILWPDGSTAVLELPPGLPLGIGDGHFETRELRLPAGATLVLCTDGLVESRERDIDEGMAALCETLKGADSGLEQMCDTTIEALRPNHDRDDIALLMARVHTLTPDQIATTTLPTSPSSVHRARALVRATLSGWGLSGILDTAELLVSELVTNAVQHGRGPVEVRLLRSTTFIIEVGDSSLAPPLLRTPDSLAETGRGLQLIKSLAQRWGIRRGPDGKIVWCDIAILPPDAL
ncbi:MAG: Serine phosphatase RsbU regulator of sigma subunit-like protein [Streptosporangiaceae bacterium]|nr:Serine phosphatase RsbU regulator of sigma subunit-like protein [Streptosporangiaceae bacterium]